MAYAYPDGAGKTLHWHGAGSACWRTPPLQRADDSQIAERINPERRSDAKGRGDDATQRGTDRAADIEADAVGGHGFRQVSPGNELRHDRLPSRGDQGGSRADQEGEQ